MAQAATMGLEETTTTAIAGAATAAVPARVATAGATTVRVMMVREVAPYLTRFAHPRVRARAPGGKAAAVTARAAVELEVALEVVSPTR